MSSSSARSWSEPAVSDRRVACLIAPGEWRSIEFVSDLHLSPETPRTLAAFERYLRHTRADAIVILGDLFEVWIGDDIESDAFALRCLAALRDAATRCTVAMMVGNRDFLVGTELLAGHGVIALDDPAVLEAFGRRVVLAHGDALCLADTDYQAFRRQVRAPAWQAAFLAKPRAERAELARAMRDASEARKGRPADHADGDTAPSRGSERGGAVAPMATWADADPAATIAMLAALESDTLVHGHTHRPCTHGPAVDGAPTASVRHVLSDWDLDDVTAPRAEVLRLTAAGFERAPL